MLALNLTGRHLNGSDRRCLARAFRRWRNAHRRRLVRDCGEERAAPIRERARREERELLVPTPGGLIGAGVWLHGHGERKGRLSFDFALWSADPQKTPVDRYPVVRI